VVIVRPALSAVILAGILTLGLVVVASAQDALPTPDLRMLLNQSPARGLADSPPAPDLRDLPQPRLDRPSSTPPVTVVIGGDPHCDPAEDGLLDRRTSRSRRSR